MEKVKKETCALCQKKYVPHHNKSFRTELCGPCEDDILYWEEVQEMQATMEQD